MEFYKALWDSEELKDLFAWPQPKPQYCLPAQEFSEWVSWVFEKIVTEKPTIVSINQTKALLVDQYFAWCGSVDNFHRDRQGLPEHPCIYQVFFSALKRVKLVELTLRPPQLFLPLERPSQPQIAGIFLGETEEE